MINYKLIEAYRTGTVRRRPPMEVDLRGGYGYGYGYGYGDGDGWTYRYDDSNINGDGGND